MIKLIDPYQTDGSSMDPKKKNKNKNKNKWSITELLSGREGGVCELRDFCRMGAGVQLPL